jgi:hypothetical protein
VTARPRKAAAVPAAAPKPDFATLLAGARLPERTVSVCLRGDLVAEHEQADRELEKLIDKPSQKFGGDGRGQLQQQIRDLEAEMAAATYDFRLRALPRAAWHAFIAEHPPRREPDNSLNASDAATGVNVETFYEALIRRCLIDPDLDDEAWFRLTESLTDRQFDDLASAAWGLNRRDVDVPFSRAAWRQSQISELE